MMDAGKAKMSPEEILEQAARLVGQTINPEAMGLKPDDIDLDQFIKLFIQRAREMLNEKEQLLLGIGPYLNSEGTLFTEDMKSIIEFIEKESKTKFYFYNGILVGFGKREIYANWIPDRPF